jgi:hypothetical protein
MATVEQLRKLYAEYEEAFEYAREQWEATGGKRTENYWQGKKDGLRTAMNLLHQLIAEE